MVNIHFHHSTIGLFLDKVQSLSSKLKGRLSIFVESSKKKKVVKISIYLNLNSVNVCESINSGNHYWNAIKMWRHRDNLRSNLQLGEDSAGSKHQGNSQLFAETAGIQCGCNALYALCWTQVKQIFHWVRRDLDHVLIEGDNLYKILHMSDMLSVDQLPVFLKMYNLDIPVQYLRLETQLATLIKGDSFLGDLLTTGGNKGITLCLLFMERFTTGIILLRNCYYLLDSHSCDERGLSVVNGTSVLMKLRDCYELEKHLQVAYLENRDRQQAFFQLQFVKVN